MEKPGPYIESFTRLKDRSPYLYFLEKARREWKDDAGTCKATVLELHGDRFLRRDLPTSTDMKDYLASRAKHDHPNEKDTDQKVPVRKQRIYIIQDLSNAYLETLGSHFQIDPYIFASQAWVAHWSGNKNDFGMPQRLPSLHSRTTNFTLRYYELNTLHGSDRTNPESRYKIKTNLQRRVERMSGDDGFGRPIFFVRRNVSFWQCRNGSDWDVIILAEPSIQFENEALRGEPYRHGYPDYIPWSSAAATAAVATAQSPPMTAQSMSEAIATYWTDIAQPAEIQAVRNDPSKVGGLLETICSSHWMVMFDYMWTKLNDSEMSLKEITDHHGWPDDKTQLMKNVKKTLMDGIAWKRRLNWICGEMDASLKSLRVGGDSRVSASASSASSASHLAASPDDNYHLDLRHMRAQMDMLKAEYRQFSEYLASILEVFQGETALEEAKTSTRLSQASEALTRLSVQLAEKSYEEGRRSAEFAQISTILTAVGVVFIPLTYTASIFSMASDYGPDGGHFWVYWAVAAPLAVLTVVLFSLFSRTERLYRSLAWVLFGPYADTDTTADQPREKKKKSEGPSSAVEAQEHARARVVRARKKSSGPGGFVDQAMP